MMRRYSYIWTLLLQSLVERKSLVLVSLLTVALGSSVIGAFIILNADIETKMSRELRAYGANFVVKPRVDGEALRSDVVSALAALIPSGQLVGVQPFLYDIVTLKGNRIAAAGIDFGRIEETMPYWQLVEGALPAAGASPACLLGREAAGRRGVSVGAEVELKQGDRAHRCTIAALVETGGAEDSQLFLPIEEARGLFNRPDEIDLVLASIISGVREAEAFALALEQRVPGCRAQPIHKLSHSEGKILESIRSIIYVVVMLVTISTFVCLLISLMAMVSERRKEMALMKTLGATDLGLSLHFLMEIAVTGLLGGHVGLAVGFGMAHLMERTIFGTAVTFHWWILPLVPAVALGISIAGAVIPLKTVAAVQPAVVLKGD